MNKLYDKIKQNSYYDIENDIIVLGEIIELRLTSDKIDVYKYADLADIDIENYNFDDDYITTIYL